MKKILYQPVKPFILGQKFGENKACIKLDHTGGVIVCDGNNPPPGYTSVYGPGGHTGIDLGVYHGQEVYCAQAGRVIEIDTEKKSGLDVRIISVIDGETVVHIYEHLLGYQVQVGSLVKTGQLIGWADNTGWSSGDHLHFQVEKNGIPIDPLPLMEAIFAKDILKVTNAISYIKEQIAFVMDRIADLLRK